MNIIDAKAAARFAVVTDKDEKERPTIILVPGHKMARYQVEITRTKSINLVCKDIDKGEFCPSKTFCYHCLAALIVIARNNKVNIAFTQTEEQARTLARVQGDKIFPIVNKGQTLYAVFFGNVKRKL